MICYIVDNTMKNMYTKFEINRKNGFGDIWYTAHAGQQTTRPFFNIFV